MKKIIILILGAIIGLGINANGQAYSKDLEKQANGGDTRAMVAVGDAYLQGNGIGKDLKKAEKWYKKAIDKDDNLVAYERMADLYRSWDGIAKKPSEVKKWAEKGAKLGNPRLAMEVAEGYYSNDENYQWTSSESKIDFIYSLYELATDSGSVDAAKRYFDISVDETDLGQAKKALNYLKKMLGAQSDDYKDSEFKLKSKQAEIGNLSSEQIFDTQYLNSQGIKYRPGIEYVNALILANSGQTDTAKQVIQTMLDQGGYMPNNLSRVYLFYLTLGETEALRFLNQLLSVDPAIIERWLTDNEAVNYLKNHKKDLKDPLLAGMLPPDLTTAQINTMLNMARR